MWYIIYGTMQLNRGGQVPLYKHWPWKGQWHLNVSFPTLATYMHAGAFGKIPSVSVSTAL